MKLPKLSLKSLAQLPRKALVASGASVLVIGAGLTSTLIATQSQTGADPIPPIQIQVNQNTEDIEGLKTKTDDLQIQVDGKEDRSTGTTQTGSQSSGSESGSGSTPTPSGGGSNPTPSNPTPSNPDPAPQPRTAFSKLVTIQAGSITSSKSFPGYTNTSGTNYLSTIGNGGEPYAVEIPITRISNFTCALDTGYLEDNTITRAYLYVGQGIHKTQNLTVDLPASVTGDICNYLYTHQRTAYVANGSSYYTAGGSIQNAGQTLYLKSDSLSTVVLGSANQIANPY